MRTAALRLLVAARAGRARCSRCGGHARAIPCAGLLTASSTRRARSSFRGWTATRRSSAPSRGPWARSCARATRSARATRTGCATTRSSTSGASRCRSPPPRSSRSPVSARSSTSRVAGYVAAVLAIFALLLLRFRLPIAGAVAARHGLPAGADRPLELPAHRQLGAGARDRGVRFGLLVLDRGPRWLIPWTALHPRPRRFTRDSTWIPIARGRMANPHVEVEGRVWRCSARPRRSRPGGCSSSRCRCGSCWP